MYYISQPLYVMMSESYNHCLSIFESGEINVSFTTDVQECISIKTKLYLLNNFAKIMTRTHLSAKSKPMDFQ